MLKKKVWIWIVSVVVVLAIGGTIFYLMNKGPKMAVSEMEEMPVAGSKSS